jgi:hypothetical protein
LVGGRGEDGEEAATHAPCPRAWQIDVSILTGFKKAALMPIAKSGQVQSEQRIIVTIKDWDVRNCGKRGSHGKSFIVKRGGKIGRVKVQ